MLPAADCQLQHVLVLKWSARAHWLALQHGISCQSSQQMAGSFAGIRNALSTGGSSDGADKQPLGLHAPSAPALRPATSEAQRQAGEAGTLQESTPFGVAAPAPAGLRPSLSEFQRRQGEAGGLAGAGLDPVGSSGRDAGLHRDNSASGMLVDSVAGSSAEWAGATTSRAWACAACWLFTPC